MSDPLGCIIIDDPRLVRRYGFIEFPEFLAWLVDEGLAATFAFIPWNYTRTAPEIAQLFVENSGRMSICVHGCNHTKGEFASTDTRYLEGICALARSRMVAHHRQYGVPWDNVMVFPQGQFSREAMHALRATGYSAAVNTADPDQYSVVGRYVNDFGFPLIIRRYPRNLDDFVRDNEAGRPLLVVQHHWDFAEGFGPLTRFVRTLRSRIPHVKWLPLGEIVTALGIDASAPGHSCDPIKQSPKDRARIATRRYLCEIRDNYVQPLRRTLSAATRRGAASVDGS
jgi:hypothetical protein